MEMFIFPLNEPVICLSHFYENEIHPHHFPAFSVEK